MNASDRHPHARGRGITSQRSRDRLVAQLRAAGITDERVLGAMARVPRHEFIDEAFSYKAYADTALPIGHGQTISQPFVVALMTALLVAEPAPQNVLEIGTGSGYQAAVLAELVANVYSVERIPVLHQQARTRLRKLSYHNVRLRLADGSLGLPDYAPFDRILVTAAAADLPEPLLDQLSEGGRLLAPIGGKGEQRLLSVTRSGDDYQRKELDPVSFVPLLPGVAV